MRARWETTYGTDWTDCTILERDGWEPYAVDNTAFRYRRLVVAKCAAGHDADFNDETCKFDSKPESDSKIGICGKPIVAVPIDPFDIYLGEKK